MKKVFVIHRTFKINFYLYYCFLNLSLFKYTRVNTVIPTKTIHGNTIAIILLMYNPKSNANKQRAIPVSILLTNLLIFFHIIYISFFD